MTPRLAAALAEYRSRHCRPGCPRCTSPEGILACSRDAAWTALARIKARLHDPA